jgi:hypothetical protein
MSLAPIVSTDAKSEQRATGRADASPAGAASHS